MNEVFNKENFRVHRRDKFSITIEKADLIEGEVDDIFTQRIRQI